MSAKSINFGTDGWRAVIAEEFTFENIDLVAQATADFWKKNRPKGVTKKVVIGFGITEKTIQSLKKADGLVVGSAICKEISKSIAKRQNVVTNVTNVVKRLKNKIL